MKFIAKHLNLIGLALFSGFALATAALYFGVPSRVKAAPEKAGETCPMHSPAAEANHDCGQEAEGHSSCATESHGCCSTASSPLKQLPAGHPPVEGYTVAPASVTHGNVPE